MKLRCTKRGLYFAALWLPFWTLVFFPLAPTAFFWLLYAAPCCVPIALYFTIRGRAKPTAQLLGKAWQIPIAAALWAGVSVLAEMQITRLREPNDDPFVGHASIALGVYTVVAFALLALVVGFVCIALGWLMLHTFARNWPLERAAEPPSRARAC